jgi:hypothetical protein
MKRKTSYITHAVLLLLGILVFLFAVKLFRETSSLSPNAIAAFFPGDTRGLVAAIGSFAAALALLCVPLYGIMTKRSLSEVPGWMRVLAVLGICYATAMIIFHAYMYLVWYLIIGR